MIWRDNTLIEGYGRIIERRTLYNIVRFSDLDLSRRRKTLFF